MKILAAVPERLAPTLAAHPLFADLPGLARAAFLRDCNAIALDTDEVLMHQYDEGHSGFLLLDGRLRVEVIGSEHRDRRETIGRLAPGAVVGEMGAISGELRSASVQAETPCVLLEIPGRALHAMLTDSGTATRHLAGLLARRIAHAECTLYDLAHGRGASDVAAGDGHVRPLAARLYARFVRSRLQDPVFLVLAWFLGVLLLNRLVFDLWTPLRDSGVLLRALYLFGLGLFVGCSLTLLFAYRRASVRLAACGIGAGLGLVVNKLSLLIAFDIFYAGMTALGPERPFSYAELYQRSEWVYVALVLLAVLLLLVYFRGLLRLAVYALRARLQTPSPPLPTEETKP